MNDEHAVPETILFVESLDKTSVGKPARVGSNGDDLRWTRSPDATELRHRSLCDPAMARGFRDRDRLRSGRGYGTCERETHGR